MKSTEKAFDGSLVLKCRSGDKKAYVLLVKRWHQRFCRQAFWYCKDADLAKDIAQDSWTTIFKKLDTLTDPNSFGSWALSIVNRKSIDVVRKLSSTDKKLRIYYKDLKDNVEHYTNDKTSIYVTNGDVKDHSRIVIKAIKKLPESQQLVLRLFYVEEYSILEISEILKVSKGTVKSRLFYAREKLKLIFKNKNDEKS